MNSASTIFIAAKHNWRISTIALLIFLPLLFLFTGILNRYIFVPDWYPNKPVIFTPGVTEGRPPFTQYTFAWKFSEHWLSQINLTDSLWLLLLSCLFFLNIALMAETYKNKARFATVNWLAYPLAFFAFVGCCGSTLFIFLFGAGTLIAFAPYVEYFRIFSSDPIRI